MKKLTPVIHVTNQDQALKNVDICLRAGTYGFFLINHHISCNKLIPIVERVKREYPSAWVGVNVLDKHPLKYLPKFENIDVQAFWLDNPLLVEDVMDVEQTPAKLVRDMIKLKHPQALYFGGVAFKYQVQPKNLENFTRMAMDYLDVITTSGEQTGSPADLYTVRKIYNVTNGKRELAIASGITVDNAFNYLPYVDRFLVSTGISTDFENLDEGKVMALQAKVNSDIIS